jgi:hypothetical protein
MATGFSGGRSRSTPRLAAASDKVYQLFAHGRWFSPGTPTSSTTKAGRHDIAEILLKVALNTIKQTTNLGTKEKNTEQINAYLRSVDLDFHFLSILIHVLLLLEGILLEKMVFNLKCSSVFAMTYSSIF